MDVTAESHPKNRLTSDDCALIDRVRQRFLNACSSHRQVPDSTRDAMNLVDVIERLVCGTGASEQGASSALVHFLTAEERTELDAAREKYRSCVLPSALLLIVDRLVMKLEVLENVLYLVRCARDGANAEVDRLRKHSERKAKAFADAMLMLLNEDAEQRDMREDKE